MLPEYSSNAPLARDDVRAGGLLQNTPEQEAAHQAEIKHFLQTVPRMKPMSAEEHACQHFEENTGKVAKYRFANQGEVEEFRPGRILHHKDFLRKLKTIRADFAFNDFSRMGRIGICIEELGLKKYTGTTVQFGYSPEYSKIRMDSHGVGKEEQYRGWRTALLHLISREFITEEQSERAFGFPVGPHSHRYLRQLWEHRNKRAWPYAA